MIHCNFQSHYDEFCDGEVGSQSSGMVSAQMAAVDRSRGVGDAIFLCFPLHSFPFLIFLRGGQIWKNWGRLDYMMRNFQRFS